MPTDNLAAAKAILEKPVDELGDFELTEVLARATVALADAVRDVARSLRTHNLSTGADAP